MIGKTISHYKILEKLGEGGMGVVYKAEDTRLKRPVALKFLKHETVGDSVEKKRFLYEAQAAARLDHPNICSVYEVDHIVGQSFIAMAYVDGQSLKDRLEGGPLEIDQVLDTAGQIAEGLNEAHEKGIIHRDIKPSNIMLTTKGLVKIMDFGLAKLSGVTRVTKTGSTIGTMAYMSPEQARGEEMGRSTDIWSFGVVLYEMLTGRLPFQGEYEAAVLYSILNRELDSVSTLRPDTPRNLQRIIEKSLKKEPADRYLSMADVIEELKLTSSQKPEPQTQEKSIAVLAFTNMSADPEQDFFCDGISEEIINALTQVRNLKVIARTSAFSFKGKNVDVREIGKKLGVEHLLEGSVRKAGDRLRITAQLVKASDGSHIWSQRYDRNMEDVFEIQDEIALAIVENLKIKLFGNERDLIVKRYTENLEAYNLYLKGCYLFQKWTVEGFEKAIDSFQQAIKLDPNYALAYAGMAEVYFFYAFFGNYPPTESTPKAIKYLKSALELDETLAEAHATLGYINALYDWNIVVAATEFKRAIDLNPNASMIQVRYSNYLLVDGQYEHAINAAKHASKLDPLSSSLNTWVGEMIWMAGQTDEAIEHLQNTIALEPGWYFSHLLLGMVYMGKSMIEEAMPELELAFELSGELPIAVWHLSASYYRIGRKTEADRLFNSLKDKAKQEYIPPLFFSILHRARGEKDPAFEWLAKACEDRDIFLTYCLVWPDDLYRIPYDEPSTELLKKAGLPM